MRRVCFHEHSLVYGSSLSHGVAVGMVVQLFGSQSQALCQGNGLLDKMQLLHVYEQKILAEAAATPTSHPTTQGRDSLTLDKANSFFSLYTLPTPITHPRVLSYAL